MVEPSAPPPLERLLRRAAGFVPSGVFLLSHGEVVMRVSTLQCLSCDPPVVSVVIDPWSPAGQTIAAAGTFAARLLRDSEAGHARDATLPRDGTALVALECETMRVEPVGDHALILARVSHVRLGDGTPLVLWRHGLHTVRLDYPFLATPAALSAFVAAWEAGTLPRRDWTHAAHVAVAACYRLRHGADALARTRDGIVHYNAAVGTPNTDSSGYHETLTRFWADVVARLTAGCENEWEAARLAVGRLGEDRDLHAVCYAHDVVRSTAARRSWVEPDWLVADVLP